MGRRRLAPIAGASGGERNGPGDRVTISAAMPVHVLFTDNLADLPLKDAIASARRAGFEGIDLTLRPGGHVLPENAEVGLSEAHRLAGDAGAVIPMASTAVTSASSPHAEAIFAAAAHYGVRRLKLGYWPYTPFGKLAGQIDAARRDLEGVVKLGQKYHVLPCVHCHSGRLVAAGGPLLYLLLRDFKPTEVGAYLDPMHMTIEGGVAGWEMGLDLLAPWSALVGVKNFRWVEAARDDRGQLRYRWQYVPIADGQAPLPDFVARLKDIRYDGVVSLHSEYKGETSWRRLSTPELVEQSAADLEHWRALWR